MDTVSIHTQYLSEHKESQRPCDQIGQDHPFCELSRKHEDKRRGPRTQYLPDTDLPGTPFSHEGGQSKQTQAGNGHAEDREYIQNILYTFFR